MRNIIMAFSLFFIVNNSFATNVEITAYTDIEPEIIKQFSQEFKKQYPDIHVKWVRDSAGPISARLIAEKEKPKADVVFGLALSSLLSLAPYDLFEAYKANEYDALADKMRDNSGSFLWTGVNSWSSNLCVNEVELKKRNLPIPRSLKDLTHPIYQGLIVMPNPVSSSSGYMDVAGWLQTMGNEQAWQFMQALHKNIKMYTHSGCKPCQMAAQGEAVIGISTNVCAFPFIKRKAPLLTIIPQEGANWELEVAALVKGTPHTQAAQKLIDFAASDAASKITIRSGCGPVRKVDYDVITQKSHTELVNLDISKSVANREATLNKWRSLFDKK